MKHMLWKNMDWKVQHRAERKGHSAERQLARTYRRNNKNWDIISQSVSRTRSLLPSPFTHILLWTPVEVLLSVQRTLGAISSSGRWAVHDSCSLRGGCNETLGSVQLDVRPVNAAMPLGPMELGVSVLMCRAVCICFSPCMPLEESIYCLVYFLCLWRKSGSMHLILFSYAFRIHLHR